MTLEVEKISLKNFKDRINKGIKLMADTWREVAKAARQIHDQELWRHEAKSWNQFCEDNGWSRRRLNVVPRKRRPKVLAAAAKNGPITAKAIEAAAAAPPPKPTIPLDKQGTKIPPPAWPYWERRDEVQPFLTQLSAMKSALKKAEAEKDNLYAWVWNIGIPYLSQAYSALSNAKKCYVCTMCKGWFDKLEDGCSTCKNTGLITQYQFDHCSLPETKAIRELANQSKK